MSDENGDAAIDIGVPGLKTTFVKESDLISAKGFNVVETVLPVAKIDNEVNVGRG